VLDLLAPPPSPPRAPSFEPIAVAPHAARYDLLLTTLSPVSHHDPAIQDDSNRTLFNRQRQILPGGAASSLPDQAAIDRLCQAEPLPADVADLFEELSFAEYVAAALVRRFLDLYNSGEGSGLFSGLERYARLETRVRGGAVIAPNLRTWWDRLTDSLQVPIGGGDADRGVLALLAVPGGLGQLVLRVLERDYRSVCMLARAWHQAKKIQSDLYAERAGVEAGAAGLVVLAFSASALVPARPRRACSTSPA